MAGAMGWIEPDAPFWETLRRIPTNLSGVYALMQMRTHRLYVGVSEDIAGRIRQHLNELRWGNHRNKQLEQAWKHDGPRGFHIIVLEPVSNLQWLAACEAFWIDKLHSMHPYGFNRRTLTYRNANTHEWRDYWSGTNEYSSRAQLKRKHWARNSPGLRL